MSFPTQPKFHTEDDFILSTLRCCFEYGGEANFEDLRDYMEHHLDLNEADEIVLPSKHSPRWHQILRNLKSNKSMGGWVEDIPHGFRITPAGVVHMNTQTYRLPSKTLWTKTDRRLATREQVCARWGNQILIQLRNTRLWKVEELRLNVDGGQMTVSEFQQKYKPEQFRPISSSTSPFKK